MGIFNEVYEIYTKLEAKKDNEESAFRKLMKMYDVALRAARDGVHVATGVGTGMEAMFQHYNVESALFKEGQINQSRLEDFRRRKK